MTKMLTIYINGEKKHSFSISHYDLDTLKVELKFEDDRVRQI